jgi:head-tail adaptor
MIPLKLSDMNVRVGLAGRTATVNSSTGEVTDAYGTVSYIWAKVQEGAGMEGIKSGAEYNKEMVSLIVRKGTLADERSRVIYDSKAWDIESLENLDRNFMIIRCKRA